jgi:hypothetical protein
MGMGNYENGKRKKSSIHWSLEIKAEGLEQRASITFPIESAFLLISLLGCSS